MNDKKEAHLLDGVYHLRYEAAGKRVWESVGTRLGAAEAQRNIRDGELSLGTADRTPVPVTLVDQQAAFMELKELFSYLYG